jgi:hypothetical protein
MVDSEVRIGPLLRCPEVDLSIDSGCGTRIEDPRPTAVEALEIVQVNRRPDAKSKGTSDPTD